MDANSALAPSPPQLTPEVLLCIIEVITDSRDLPNVWFSFRLVSRSFKQLTEWVFMHKHLPHAAIKFPNKRRYLFAKGDNAFSTGLVLAFDRVSEDHNERAIFRSRQENDKLDEIILRESSESGAESSHTTLESTAGDTLSSHIAARLKEHFDEYSQSVEPRLRMLPIHLICIRRVADDTTLPGLELNWEDHTVSVLWKEMLSALFGLVKYEDTVVERIEEEFKRIDLEYDERFPSRSAKYGEEAAIWVARAKWGARSRIIAEPPERKALEKTRWHYGWRRTFGHRHEDEVWPEK